MQATEDTRVSWEMRLLATVDTEGNVLGQNTQGKIGVDAAISKWSCIGRWIKPCARQRSQAVPVDGAEKGVV